MERYLEQATAFFDIPLDLRSRVLLILAACMVVPAIFLPLWTMTFESPRYEDGLGLRIYAHRLAGEKPADLLEINALNHYMGMQIVEETNFTQFQWFPFLLGVTIMLCLRVVVLGKMSKLVDLFFLYVYSLLFALWTFQNGLSTWGHRLNPYATVRIDPFTPPLWGQVTVGGVDLSAAPSWGMLFLVLVPVLFLAAMSASRQTWRSDHRPKQDYLN